MGQTYSNMDFCVKTLGVVTPLITTNHLYFVISYFSGALSTKNRSLNLNCKLKFPRIPFVCVKAFKQFYTQQTFLLWKILGIFAINAVLVCVDILNVIAKV